MFVRPKYLLIALQLFSGITVSAQQAPSMGWLFLSHTQKINDKLDLLADVQLRSREQFSKFSTLLIRPALSYNFNKQHSVAVGFVSKTDWEVEDGEFQRTLEQRIFQQYVYNTEISRIELILRGRLEQRFVKEEAYLFSQRGRVFLSAQIPLVADQDFTKGWYAKIQDEIFLNIQHQEHVNNSLLDQNRPYAGLGYRANKHADIELGYMRWLQREFEEDQRSNVFQLMITTSF